MCVCRTYICHCNSCRHYELFMRSRWCHVESATAYTQIHMHACTTAWSGSSSQYCHSKSKSLCCVQKEKKIRRTSIELKWYPEHFLSLFFSFRSMPRAPLVYYGSEPVDNWATRYWKVCLSSLYLLMETIDGRCSRPRMLRPKAAPTMTRKGTHSEWTASTAERGSHECGPHINLVGVAQKMYLALQSQLWRWRCCMHCTTRTNAKKSPNKFYAFSNSSQFIKCLDCSTQRSTIDVERKLHK